MTLRCRSRRRWGTFHDETLAWEAARNLNLIQRGGPDELAASYANGSASFALDLEPGTYDVWLLSGDNGLLEYVPHEPFEVEVEGVRAAFAPPSAQQWIWRFETPGADDAIDVEAAYERYVAPRFRWRRLTVPVLSTGSSPCGSWARFAIARPSTSSVPMPSAT